MLPTSAKHLVITQEKEAGLKMFCFFFFQQNNDVELRDVEAVIFQPFPLPHLSLPLPLSLTKNEKTTLDNFLTFVGL